MKISVRQLRETIQSAVRDARLGARRPTRAASARRRSLREGAEVAAIADAFDELAEMPGWDALGDEGEAALATLKKLRARITTSANSDV